MAATPVLRTRPEHLPRLRLRRHARHRRPELRPRHTDSRGRREHARKRADPVRPMPQAQDPTGGCPRPTAPQRQAPASHASRRRTQQTGTTDSQLTGLDARGSSRRTATARPNRQDNDAKQQRQPSPQVRASLSTSGSRLPWGGTPFESDGLAGWHSVRLSVRIANLSRLHVSYIRRRGPVNF